VVIASSTAGRAQRVTTIGPLVIASPAEPDAGGRAMDRLGYEQRIEVPDT
jgi:hypothetical protein